ncbi:MAG: MarR family transcriptional regulator [Ancalomicrobiaceae bacterium]|nr:MarR family transcriptional regulator [Ancalomicrobiaceae bacterium]
MNDFQTPRAARGSDGRAVPEQSDAAAGHDKSVDMEPLTRSVGYQLRRAQLAVFYHFIHCFADYDIRPAQFSVMVLIDRNPGLNQSEIAAALGIKRTNFVALIDSLDRRGLATRMSTQSDRRSYALYLTDSGRTLVQELLRLQAEHEARIISRIGIDGRDKLVSLLADVTAAFGGTVIEE